MRDLIEFDCQDCSKSSNTDQSDDVPSLMLNRVVQVVMKLCEDFKVKLFIVAHLFKDLLNLK